MSVRPWAAVFAGSLLWCGIAPAAGGGFKVIKTRIRIEECRKAVAKARPGPVVKLEYKWREQRLVYEFAVAGEDGYRWELECDGYSGRLTEMAREVRSPDDPDFKAKRRISLDAARSLAVAHRPGEIVETEFEIKASGDASYEFDIRATDGREWKLEVDAATGRIVGDAQEEFRQVGGD